jgi:aminopeptidase N
MRQGAGTSLLIASTLMTAACATGASQASNVRSESAAGASLRVQPWTTQCNDLDAVDALHHEVQLTLQLQPVASISGSGFIRVRAKHSTSVVVLDARDLKVTSAKVGQVESRFQQFGQHLCVELPKGLAARREISIELAWQVATDREVPKVFADQVWGGYRTSSWMPTRQDSAQRATLALQITAPTSLKVAASGRLVSRKGTPEGTTTHTFVQDRPSPPFLYAFAAGSFAEAERRIDALTLRVLGPPQADLASALLLSEAIYRLFQERTGMALPLEEYVQVFVHGDAAQEAAGLVLLADSSLADLRDDPNEDWIFSHEFAHQWFAWLIACADFSDFWLNEGFATFFVGVFKEHRLGPGAYEQELTRWRESSARVHAQSKEAPLSLSPPGARAHEPPAEDELQARGITYSRGALVLHKLRSELGEAVFWNGIRRYVARRAGKGARSEDLRTALEEASARDLTEFFARWVYAPAPDL